MVDETAQEETNYDVKDLKEVLKLVIELGETAEKAFSDKKFEMSELALLITPLMYSSAAFEGMSNVSKEIKDLDAAEMLEIKEYVASELDLENDRIEAIVEKAIDLVVGVMSFISLLKK